jgi:hypothetical protein
MKIRDINEEFNIKILPPMGSGEVKKPVTVVGLVREIPYLIQSGFLPSRKVLNDIFSRGINDAGMSGGCEWEPFQITEEGFSELVNKATDINGSKVSYSVPPDWVEDIEDFQIWIFDMKHGVPWEKHKQLKDAYNEAKRKTADAKSEQEKEECFVKEIEAGNELEDYIDEYL